MAFIDDLAKASKLFNQNATGLAVQQQVNDASTQMEEMRKQLVDGHIKDRDFRKQSNDLARALQANLVGIGAQPTEIQQAFNAIAPQRFQNQAQAIAAGEMGVAGELEGASFQARERRQQADFARQKQLLGIKEGIMAKNKGKKPLTEQQASSRMFGTRMSKAIQDLNSIKDFDPASASAAAQSVLPNFLRSAEYQKFDNSRENFTSAVLRKESGAAISESERDAANELYFPMPGDSPEVLAQKNQNRLTATKLMMELGEIPKDSELFINLEKTPGQKKNVKNIKKDPLSIKSRYRVGNE